MKYQKLISEMTLEEKCYLFSGKDFWQSRSVKRLGIPNMTMSDGPHGIRKQEGAGDQLGLNGSLPATCFPTAAAMANSWDPVLGEEMGKCLGEELLDVVFSTTKAVSEKKGHKFDINAHHAVAMKASEQSAVLLKNEGNILPLKKGTKVALIGDFAENPRYQGAGSSVVHPTKVDSMKESIKGFDLSCIGFEKGYNRVGPPDTFLEDKACSLAEKAEIVLLCIGLDEISESEGLDRAHMRLPESQIRLLEKLAKVNKNIVAVFSAGSAVEMPWLGCCRALVHGYLCGQAGAGAMLKIVTGQINPSGKLAESYPLKYEDVSSAPYFPGKERTTEYREGLYVGYRYYGTANVPVLFPFGFGLSYTDFSYSDLEVTAQKAVFTLTNTGSVDGAETAQLYVSASSSQIFRPSKELKGFQKVFLKAGESRRVEIRLDDKAFRYFNIKTNRFETEGGEYQILIGASSADIRLSGTVSISGTDAPCPYHPKELPDYYKGTVKHVSDVQFQTLLGHEIPNGHWTGMLDMNDAICQMYYAKSRIARLAYKILTNMLKKAEAKGTPDLNLLFIYNMPFRGIAKMTGGMVTMEMAEGILTAVNGRLFRGIGQIIGGFLRSGAKKKKAKQMD